MPIDQPPKRDEWIDSRKLPPPGPGERVLNEDDLTALAFPRAKDAFLAATTQQQRIVVQEDTVARLVADGTVRLRKSPSGGFCMVVAPVEVG